MSKNAPHTPGPWKVTGESYGNYISVGNDKSTVARIPWGKGDCPVDSANANLVASAPELLEALESLLIADDCGADETGYVDGVGFIDIDAVKEKARSAIAKAKGDA